ncbi:HGxxPAAW family protein [Kitasatospora sp. NPDC004272]
MSAHGDHDMGHTVAGWTGSLLAVLGFTAAGAAFVLGSVAGLWGGGLLMALGAVASWVLHLAGWGKPAGPRPPHHRHWRTRDPASRHGHPDCLGCRLAGRRGPACHPSRRPANASGPAGEPVAPEAG